MNDIPNEPTGIEPETKPALKGENILRPLDQLKEQVINLNRNNSFGKEIDEANITAFFDLVANQNLVDAVYRDIPEDMKNRYSPQILKQQFIDAYTILCELINKSGEPNGKYIRESEVKKLPIVTTDSSEEEVTNTATQYNENEQIFKKFLTDHSITTFNTYINGYTYEALVKHVMNTPLTVYNTMSYVAKAARNASRE